MKRLVAAACLAVLTACGTGGPPAPDWKVDSADLIERYKKHALLGENTIAERYFQQAIAATGGAGRVADTARLWLVRCATRRAMLLDDACTEYAELARIEPNPTDYAYYRFITLRWNDLDVSHLPGQHREFMRAAPERRTEALRRVDEPLARLLDASLIVMRQEATRATLEIATETASARGWRQPLLTYLKLLHKLAVESGDAHEQERLKKRIDLVEKSLFP